MDSIRGSRLAKDQERMSVQSGVSNRLSYISMKDKNKEDLAQDNKFLTPKKFMEEKVSTSSFGKFNTNSNND